MEHAEVLGWILLPALATLCASVLTGQACRFAPRWGLVDKPDGGRKRHGRATPLLGGVAVYLSFCFTVAVAVLVEREAWVGGAESFLGPLLVSAGLFCLLGFCDDWRPMRARHKFLLQVLAALPFALWGPNVAWVGLLGARLDFGPLAIPFTVFWLVSCANVVNLIDGLDGLASTVGIIGCLALSMLSLIAHDASATSLALIFAGCLAGFLLYNWPPAKIFLGDAGSLTIGFFIGAVSIESSLKTATGFMLACPLVLLSIPFFDTLMAILRRKLTGRGIGEPDRGHIHHLLLDRGLTRLQTLLAIAALSAVMAGAAIASALAGNDLVAVIACLGVVTAVVSAKLFGFHEASLVLRHLQVVHRVLNDAVDGFGAKITLVRHESTRSADCSALWSLMRDRVQAAGGVQLRLACEEAASGKTVLDLNWSDEASDLSGTPWQIQYSIPRDQGLCATLFASGYVPRDGDDQKVDQLLHLVASFCRSWPLPRTPVPELPDPLPLFVGHFRRPEPTSVWVENRRAA